MIEGKSWRDEQIYTHSLKMIIRLSFSISLPSHSTVSCVLHFRTLPLTSNPHLFQFVLMPKHHTFLWTFVIRNPQMQYEKTKQKKRNWVSGRLEEDWDGRRLGNAKRNQQTLRMMSGRQKHISFMSFRRKNKCRTNGSRGIKNLSLRRNDIPTESRA